MSPTTIDELELGTAERSSDRFYGKYRGTVSDNQDQQLLGSLQARVPEVLGETTTGWALPCAPYGGASCGFFAIPPVGAGVWIELEAGDPSRPIWTGTWWGSGEVPTDQTGATTQTTTKIFRSDQGLLLALDDSKQAITLSDSTGTNLLTIKSTEGTIEIRSATKIELEAPLIHHGSGASHAEVFGDQLLSYLSQLVSLFNSHMHPGELAAGMFPVTPTPPVPPMTPPTPALLSTKNFNA